jgi:Family of unknown function (DUF6544)
VSTLGREGELPALARRYFARALPSAGSVPRQVRVTQEGEMWLKPGGRALPFRAVEDLSVEEVAFSWRARFRVLPLVTLRVVDGYAAGQGRLEARLLGLVPVMRQSGQAASEGEAMRYLSEIPWVPHAMRANRQLEWRELDAHTVEVATAVGPARVAVQLEFDAAGDIVSAYSPARPHVEGKTTVPRPWGGVFRDYDVVGGVRIPTHAEVRWQLPEGPFTYWRGTITSVELVQ